MQQSTSIRTGLSVVLVVLVAGMLGMGSAPPPGEQAPKGSEEQKEARCIPAKESTECCTTGGGCNTENACKSCSGCWESQGGCGGYYCRT
jgi:hypothetical protein